MQGSAAGSSEADPSRSHQTGTGSRPGRTSTSISTARAPIIPASASSDIHTGRTGRGSHPGGAQSMLSLLYSHCSALNHACSSIGVARSFGTCVTYIGKSAGIARASCSHLTSCTDCFSLRLMAITHGVFSRSTAARSFLSQAICSALHSSILFAETVESESRQQSTAPADRFCTHHVSQPLYLRKRVGSKNERRTLLSSSRRAFVAERACNFRMNLFSLIINRV